MFCVQGYVPRMEHDNIGLSPPPPQPNELSYARVQCLVTLLCLLKYLNRFEETLANRCLHFNEEDFPYRAEEVNHEDGYAVR